MEDCRLVLPAMRRTCGGVCDMRASVARRAGEATGNSAGSRHQPAAVEARAGGRGIGIGEGRRAGEVRVGHKRRPRRAELGGVVHRVFPAADAKERPLEAAVAEGSTMVRIGTSLFGGKLELEAEDEG